MSLRRTTPMKWSELSDKDKIELILNHVIPHDMGEHIVFVMGEFHIPRGGDVHRQWNYPIAAWDNIVKCWWTRDALESNIRKKFDPLHDMNDAWQIVEHITKQPEAFEVSRQLRASRFALWWEKANLWAMSPSAAADSICLKSLEICEVRIES